MERGRVRWACREHERSSVGDVLELIPSSKVGCRPVGKRKEAENVDSDGWCRAAKEKRVGEGFVSSPTTVKNPPKESSSGSLGDSTERTPTSRRLFGVVFLRLSPCV
jgi:hypothetical protein